MATTLLPQHLDMLQNESAISAAQIRERGYYSATTSEELAALGFAAHQRNVPALVIPQRDVFGHNGTYILRPDTPRTDAKGKPIKYEMPAGARMKLDVPASVQPLLGDPSIPLVITEGSKKVDAALSHAMRCVVGLFGVWNWRGTNDHGGKTVLADWESIALNGRTVTIAPDSDLSKNKHVWNAAQRLAAYLESKGAHVHFLVMPPLPDGGKRGLDDHFAHGGTLDELRGWTSPKLPPAPAASESPSGSENTEVSNEPRIRFRTARQIASSVPTRPNYLVEGYVVGGGITELDGLAKAAGKTTFTLALCAAVLRGQPFLGRPTRRTSVVYLTEQSDASFNPTLRRAGLGDCDDFHVLTWHETQSVPWPTVVREAVEHAKAVGAGLLVVDTLPQFAGLKGDSENNAGDALAAVQPLQLAASAGLAVIMLRHERKSGGEVGNSGRGSSAFAGAVDIVLSLRRPKGNTRPTLRQLDALSRFDETPDRLMIEWTGSGYVALGSGSAVATEEARRKVLEAAPTSAKEALREADLFESAGVPRTTGQEAIRHHLESGALQRIGAGKKGEPFRYWQPGSHSAAPREDVPAESIRPEDDALHRVTGEREIHSAGTPYLRGDVLAESISPNGDAGQPGLRQPGIHSAETPTLVPAESISRPRARSVDDVIAEIDDEDVRRSVIQLWDDPGGIDEFARLVAKHRRDNTLDYPILLQCERAIHILRANRRDITQLSPEQIARLQSTEPTPASAGERS